MILKKLKEAKQVDDKKFTTSEDIAFAAAIKDADPLFSGLRDSSIRTLKNIWLSDQNENFDNTPEGFLDWFDEQYADFGDFVVKEYERIPEDTGRNAIDELPISTIRDLALNDEIFANALREIALEWGCITPDGFDTDSGKKVDIEDIVEILFLQCCSVGVHATDIDKSLPDSAPHKYTTDPKTDLTPEQRAQNADWLDKRYPNKNVRSPRLVKDLIDEIAKKIKLNESVHVCEKCGKSPCICEAEGEDVPAPEGVTFDLSNGEGEPKEVTIKPEEPSPEIQQNAFSDLINAAIQKEWEIISQINSLIATFDYEYKEENKDDITAILNQLVDDSTINVGMLHKVAELVSTKTSELLDSGEEKAEEIISEPAQDLE